MTLSRWAWLVLAVSLSVGPADPASGEALGCQDGACSTPSMPPPNRIVVSLTTTMDRIGLTRPVLERLAHEQTVPPGAVLLTLSRKPLRGGPEEPGLLPEWVTDFKGLTLRWTGEDIGPGLKLYGALASLPRTEEAALIIVDDDFVYPRTLVESLLAALLRAPSPRAAVGLRGYIVNAGPGPCCAFDYFNSLPGSLEAGQLANDYEEVDVIGAFRGYAVWRTSLPAIEDLMAFLNELPRSGLLADDDTIAGLMGEWGVQKYVAPAWAVPRLSVGDFEALSLPNSLNTFSPCSFHQTLLQDSTLHALIGRGSLGIRQVPSPEHMRRCGGRCGDRSVCFLGQCWCTAGWGGPLCNERYFHPVRNDGGRGCEEGEDGAQGCHGGVSGEICRLSCHAAPQAGVVLLPGPPPRPVRHVANLTGWQDGVRSLASGTALGTVLEINPGQGIPLVTKHIAEWRPDLIVTSLTIASPEDPPGLGDVLPSIDVPVRRWIAPLGDAMELCEGHGYDTVVSAGALAGVHDALGYLGGLWRCVRPSGLLMLKEVYYNDIAPAGPVSDNIATDPMSDLGPARIRVLRGPLNHLLSKFELVHVSDMPCEGGGRELTAIAVKK